MYEIGGVERPPAHAQKADIQAQAALHIVSTADLDRGDLRWGSSGRAPRLHHRLSSGQRIELAVEHRHWF